MLFDSCSPNYDNNKNKARVCNKALESKNLNFKKRRKTTVRSDPKCPVTSPFEFSNCPWSRNFESPFRIYFGTLVSRRISGARPSPRPRRTAPRSQTPARLYIHNYYVSNVYIYIYSIYRERDIHNIVIHYIILH